MIIITSERFNGPDVLAIAQPTAHITRGMKSL